MNEDPLARANRQIGLLEAQLQNHAMAWDHCQWTVTGELVLIGDIGFFGEAGAQGQVVAIDGDQAQVKVAADGQLSIHIFDECRSLVSRGKLPKLDDREWRH